MELQPKPKPKACQSARGVATSCFKRAPIIKANLGSKIALQVASKINSRIVLDDGGAEKLLGKGDLLASLGRGIVRAQAPLLSER